MPHTPGTWTIELCSNGGVLLLRPKSEQSHVQILPEEDGLLMAAAPDLLEACKSALHHLTHLEDNHKKYDWRESLSWQPVARGGIYGASVFARLEAAITKAEGRQP